MKNVRTLNLTGAAITGASFKTLVKQFPKLFNLIVSSCSEISPDAIDWGRDKGLIVVNQPIVKDVKWRSGQGRTVNYG